MAATATNPGRMWLKLSFASATSSAFHPRGPRRAGRTTATLDFAAGSIVGSMPVIPRAQAGSRVCPELEGTVPSPTLPPSITGQQRIMVLVALVTQLIS